MPSEPSIDFEVLLAPLPEPAIAGEDLREDESPNPAYRLLKAERGRASAAERARTAPGQEQTDPKEHWRNVLEQSQELLATRTKDLEIVAWMVEALARLEGFAGLRDGYRLASGIIDKFWDECHPQLEPAGDGKLSAQYRVNGFAGLNGIGSEGALIVPLRMLPITEPSAEDSYAFWHFQQASALEALGSDEKRKERIEAGSVSFEQLHAAARESSEEFIRDSYTAITECIEAFSELTTKFDERAGADSPPSSNITKTLDECRAALKLVASDALGIDLEAAQMAEQTEQTEQDAEPDAAPDGNSAVQTAADGSVTAPAPPRATDLQVNDREQALAELSKLAKYFRRAEPHSPISYALEQAVRWGRMPLPQLLEELIDEETARASLFRLAGIRTGGAATDDEAETA